MTSFLCNHLKQKHKIANVWTLDYLIKISVLYKANKLPPSNAPSIRLEKSDEELDSECEDDDKHNNDFKEPSSQAFFEAKHVTSDRHWFLSKFYDHLGSVDKGKK